MTTNVSGLSRNGLITWNPSGKIPLKDKFLLKSMARSAKVWDILFLVKMNLVLEVDIENQCV